MTSLQRVITGLVPRPWAASMEAESKQWTLVCPQCDYHISVWDLGGIRWKAASVSKRVWFHCPTCEEKVGARVEKRNSGE